MDRFDFGRSGELIAFRPVSQRHAARLLVVRENGEFEYAYVSELPHFLDAGDCLVVNDTREIHARLSGRRAPRPGVEGAGPKMGAN